MLLKLIIYDCSIRLIQLLYHKATFMTSSKTNFLLTLVTQLWPELQIPVQE